MISLIFLHGALGCKQHWKNIPELFSSEYDVHNLDFTAHGHNFENTSVSFLLLQEQVRNYISEKALNRVIICGYSLGGYVALRLAAQGLKGLEKVITIASKMSWSSEIAESEIGKLSSENLQVIEQKLKEEHGDNYSNLLSNTHRILRDIGQYPITVEEMGSIQIPLVMMRGDKDKMVSMEETVLFSSSARYGNNIPIQDQGHLLERMDSEKLSEALKRALDN